MKAKVKIEVHETYWIQIDCDSYADAAKKANELSVANRQPSETHREARVLALQGPFRAQKLPHADDTIVVSAPTGGTFSQRDVAAVRSAARRAGIDVHDTWNGVGCNSLSMRAVEEITHAEVDDLNARIAKLRPDYRGSLDSTPWANRAHPF